ncbi:uncharacterized protein LOC134528472 [Bacillus rossius redtenbacheri]|uniref:uncharacterized protein LOC134528472 n=1 Tax=Bacillus rossius redtenbacheri TaxID=93214 RepID=UPI002FDE9441
MGPSTRLADRDGPTSHGETTTIVFIASNVRLPINTKVKLQKIDYSTSTGVGHKYICPVFPTQQKLERRLPVDLVTRDREVLADTYKTTSGLAHDEKERTLEPGYAALTPNNQRVEYQRNLCEKLRISSAKPLRAIYTEYIDSYKPIRPITSVDTTPPSFYGYKVGYSIPVPDGQPAPALDRRSVASLLDPYVSTTHLVHGPFSPEDLAGIAQKDGITLWNHGDDPQTTRTSIAEPLMLLKKEPVYDRTKFKAVATNRTVPPLVRHVPNKGLQSEASARFRQPASCAPLRGPVGCFRAVPPASSGEILATPAMYRTEYGHLGTGWPVAAVVEPRPP